MTGQIIDAEGIQQLITSLGDTLGQAYSDMPDLALVGIQRRGDVLARRLQRYLSGKLDRELASGTLDITLYRDDFDSLAEQPIVGKTDIPFSLDGRTVILVDDVLFTGRTIRAALDVLVDLGRPKRIVLAVLIDRGWRELPIAADIVGTTLETEHEDDVQVHLEEVDGRDEVVLIRDPDGSDDG